MKTNTKPDEGNKMFSRRDALKAIVAASGAVTLAHLPEKWQTPVAEVGALPVHAQASPASPTSFSLTVAYSLDSAINNCNGGAGTGSAYNLVITYQDTSGSVSGASQLNVVSTFNPSGGTGFTYSGSLSGWPGSSSIGNSSGTLSGQLCTIFGGETSNTISATLTNDAGVTISASDTEAAPPGANSTDGTTPSQSLL